MAKKTLKLDGIDVNKWIMQIKMVREQIEEIEEKHQTELAPLRAVYEKLSGQLLEYLETTGQEMVRTSSGTAFISTRSTAIVTDAEEFFDFVIANGAFELVERRANAIACRDHAVEKGCLPPGVKINTFRTARVRTST